MTIAGNTVRSVFAGVAGVESSSGIVVRVGAGALVKLNTVSAKLVGGTSFTKMGTAIDVYKAGATTVTGNIDHRHHRGHPGARDERDLAENAILVARPRISLAANADGGKVAGNTAKATATSFGSIWVSADSDGNDIHGNKFRGSAGPTARTMAATHGQHWAATTTATRVPPPVSATSPPRPLELGPASQGVASGDVMACRSRRTSDEPADAPHGPRPARLRLRGRGARDVRGQRAGRAPALPDRQPGSLDPAGHGRQPRGHVLVRWRRYRRRDLPHGHPPGGWPRDHRHARDSGRWGTDRSSSTDTAAHG